MVSLSVSLSLVFVVLVVVGGGGGGEMSAVEPSLVAAMPSPRRDGRGGRAPTDGDRRRGRRYAPVDDVSATFGGIDDEERRDRLTELARQDVVAAVLEFNEMVLSTASGDGRDARTCWMRLNYNVTASSLSEQLTDLFRDQVVTTS